MAQRPVSVFVNAYDSIKHSDLDSRKKADTLFLFVLKIHQLDAGKGDSVSEDFLATAIKQNESYWLAKAHAAKGFVFLIEEKYPKCIKHANLALNSVNKETDYKETSFIYSILAYCYNRTSDVKKANANALQSLHYAELSKEPVLIGNFLNFIGQGYSREQKYQQAQKYFQRSLQMAIQGDEPSALFNAYTNLGINYKNLNRFDSSLYCHQQALYWAKQMSNPYNIAYAKSDLGNLYLRMKQIPQAIQLLNESVALRNRIHETWEIGYTYNFLGEAYSLSKQKKAAEKAFHAGIASSFVSNNYKQRYESYQELSKHFERNKQFDSALVYHQLYANLHDSIKTAQNEANSNLLIAGYEFEQKQSTIDLLLKKSSLQELQIKAQRVYIAAVTAGIVLVLLLLFVVYKNRKQRIEKSMLLAKIKEEALTKEAELRLREDRQRISRELHDNIGSNLIFIKESLMHLGATEASVKLMELTNETIRDLRQSVWLINHHSISLTQWVTKLREYFQFHPGIVIQFEAQNEQHQIDSVLVNEMYRVIKEAVNNAIKHSRAEHIRVHILESEQALHLSISDDGIGFENTQPGFGLTNMQTRVEQLKGNFSIHSAPNQGTQINIELKIS